MLHIHSHNMGLTAGMAWKAAGQEYVPFNEITDDSPLGKMILELLALVDKIEENVEEDRIIFLPSSFMEGFFDAFHKPYIST